MAPPDEVPAPALAPDRPSCPDCGQSFTRPYSLARHQRGRCKNARAVAAIAPPDHVDAYADSSDSDDDLDVVFFGIQTQLDNQAYDMMVFGEKLQRMSDAFVRMFGPEVFVGLGRTSTGRDMER